MHQKKITIFFLPRYTREDYIFKRQKIYRKKYLSDVKKNSTKSVYRDHTEIFTR